MKCLRNWCQFVQIFALRHAFDGFGMEYDQALELIRNKENLTPEQNTEREIFTCSCLII